jgi:GNAT superfamily N-acetyltransferase
MRSSIALATSADAAPIAALRTAAAEHLGRLFGRGPWCSQVSEQSVLRALSTSRVLVCKSGRAIIGTLRLATKKPWAITLDYFVPVATPLYLHDLAVDPTVQRQGVGRRLIEEAKVIGRAWPANAIRLDAYDAEAGAGPFYTRCGFREVGRVTYRKTPLVYYELML